MAVAVLFSRVSSARYQRDIGVRIVAMAFMIMFLLAVAVTVASVRMVMAMVMMAKASHSNQINSKTHGADDEKFRQSLRLMSFCKALNSLNYNLNTDKPGEKLAWFGSISYKYINIHEKHAIAKPRQALNLPKPVREALACGPFTRDRGEQAKGKCDAVEKHMDAVAEQS